MENSENNRLFLRELHINEDSALFSGSFGSILFNGLLDFQDDSLGITYTCHFVPNKADKIKVRKELRKYFKNPGKLTSFIQ